VTVNKICSVIFAFFITLAGAAAHATPGEYWEITTKTEMEGMSFAMPAQAIKICVDKSMGTDPRKYNKDKDCQYSDVKISGNKTSWKMRCDHNGEVTTGSGETTLINDHNMEGTMRMSTQSKGQTMNMTMKQSNKYVGGSCDTDDLARENEARNKKFKQAEKERVEKLCDPAQFRRTTDWIGNAHLFVGDKPQCPGKQQLCDGVSRDAPRVAETYSFLASRSDNGNDIAKACGLSMAAITRDICKTISDKNYGLLSAHCPAEAKALREVQRRKDCEGRSFTAETRAADLKRCLSGKDEDENEAEPVKAAPAAKSGKSGKTSNDTSADDILQNAKKLKGLFGL
jgi:hypothetical protein